MIHTFELLTHEDLFCKFSVVQQLLSDPEFPYPVPQAVGVFGCLAVLPTPWLFELIVIDGQRHQANLCSEVGWKTLGCLPDMPRPDIAL